MPADTKFALTIAVRKNWDEYWGNRPLDQKPDLTQAILDSAPVADPESVDFTLGDNAQAWEHPLIPDRVFLARHRGGGLWGVVGLVPRTKNPPPIQIRDRKRADAAPQFGVAEAAIRHLLDEVAGLKERVAVLEMNGRVG